MSHDPYEILGVPKDADTDTIKKAYRRALKRFHSDVGGSDIQTRLFSDAYQVLADPERRKEIDELLTSCRAQVTSLLRQKARVVEGIRDALDQAELSMDDCYVTAMIKQPRAGRQAHDSASKRSTNG